MSQLFMQYGLDANKEYVSSCFLFNKRKPLPQKDGTYLKLAKQSFFQQQIATQLFKSHAPH